MPNRLQRGALVAAGLGLTAGALVATPAQAATTIQVRPADLIAPSDTAGGGVQQFIAQGVYLKTPDGNAYARGRFHVGVPLAQVTTVDYTWYGTDFAPGIKYYVDADGDGKIDGELRGEKVYGGQDVWLNQDAQDFPASALPDDYFANHAPCTGGTVNAGASGPCGSSGADAHGTLADWAKKLQAATGKAPVVVDGGYSLTGAQGAGVLAQVTYGPNQYVFTNAPKTKPAIAAEAKRNPVMRGDKVKVKGTVTPAGLGATVSLEVKKKGEWRSKVSESLAADGDFKLVTKATKQGRMKLRVVVTEGNSTTAATSDTIKVRVLK